MKLTVLLLSSLTSFTSSLVRVRKSMPTNNQQGSRSTRKKSNTVPVNPSVALLYAYFGKFRKAMDPNR